MKLSRTLQLLIVAAAIACGSSALHAQIEKTEAAAEAALKDLKLDEALRLFREVLKVNPNHQRAKFVAGRLSAQMMDLDSHLAFVGKLLDEA